jgi:hypothetical protein
MRQALLCLVAFLLAQVLTLLSLNVQQVGPEIGVYGNLCGPTGREDCLGPLLQGGFPLATLVDTPGLSVERRLSFEDDFRPWGWLGNTTLYFAVVVLVWRLGTRTWAKHAKRVPPG